MKPDAIIIENGITGEKEKINGIYEYPIYLQNQMIMCKIEEYTQRKIPFKIDYGYKA